MAEALLLSKLQVARRQLEATVGLFFRDGDPVAIHTLTAAAYEVLHDLTKISGQHAMLKARVEEVVKPEHVKAFRLKLNEAENFFKHAARDPAALLRFYPGQTEILLFDAVRTYRLISGKPAPLLTAFEYWCVLHAPDLFLPLAGAAAFQGLFPSLLSMSRSEFLESLLPGLPVNG